MSNLDAFRQEMDTARAEYEVLLLDGAKHGFSNPQADENAEKYGGKESYQNLAVHFKLLGCVVVTYQFAEFSRSALDILKR